jgi:hypothetical protein
MKHQNFFSFISIAYEIAGDGPPLAPQKPENRQQGTN